MDAIRFEKLADIDTPAGLTRVAASVANDGALVFLWVSDADAGAVTERVAQGIGIFPKPRMDAPRRFRLSVWREGAGTRWIDLPPLDLTFPIVDLFPDGRVLMVAPRCSWRAEGDYDLNGVVFDPATGRADRFLLGDGINDAQVDGLGRIWVAYSDEGQFGNYGWGHPGPEPVGARGVVCFSDAGEKLWEFPEGTSMADCYAMNVWNDEVSVCFYTDFPLVHLSRDFTMTEWSGGPHGSHHLAIAGSQVLFTGGYDDPAEVGYLGTLQEDGRIRLRKVRLCLPDGSGLPTARRSEGTFVGRGAAMTCVDGTAAYRATIGQFGTS
jgi:hypothetical protein